MKAGRNESPTRKAEVLPGFFKPLPSTGQIRTRYCIYQGKAPHKVAASWGEPALPELLEPQLLAIADDVVLLRGYERIKDGSGSFAVAQEWRCEPV